MRFDQFIGPSTPHRSPNIDAERTINLYLEIPDGGATAKSRAQLLGTPGVRPWLRAVDGSAANVLGAAPVRALFHQDGRAFAIAGGVFYEVYGNHTATTRGAVAVDGRPATIASNGSAGHQLFIVSGGSGYVFDLTANTFTAITDEQFPSPALMGGFVDGYFICLKGQSIQFQISALLDGTSWDGLDVAQVSESSDQVLSLVVDHREVWLFGSKTTEVWYNSGAASFPFQPVNGAFLEMGIIAPFSAAKADNTVFWLDGDERGCGIVRRAEGYRPTRVSHHAMEDELRAKANPTTARARLRDAIGWVYQEAGHTFYCLYVPGHETTWCYDIATNLWHERALWDETHYRWTPDIGRCHAFAFDTHLVGSRSSGCLYEQSLDLYDYELVEQDW